MAQHFAQTSCSASRFLCKVLAPPKLHNGLYSLSACCSEQGGYENDARGAEQLAFRELVLGLTASTHTSLNIRTRMVSHSNEGVRGQKGSAHTLGQSAL